MTPYMRNYARRAAIYKPSAEKKSKTEKSKYSSKYPLSDIMICGECGQPYRIADLVKVRSEKRRVAL